MSNLVYCYVTEEDIARTLTDEEYNNLTKEELIPAITRCGWGYGVVDTHIDADNVVRFTKEALEKLNKKSAEQLKDFIRENNGVLLHFKMGGLQYFIMSPQEIDQCRVTNRRRKRCVT
jgi:hypothetical protein